MAEKAPSSEEMIGSYTILKSLGKGGMGEVFLVYDPLCQRKIALKKILPELARHPTIQERFLREARFAAELSHPCIIPIHYIQEEGDVYYTMPYVEGETLKEILQKTVDKESLGYHEIGVSIPTLTRIFLSICQALAYAHAKSILHRDLKPDNIIVGKYGEVFLLDWGIATHIDEVDIEEFPDIPSQKESSNLTKPGKVVGTVNFMAPERALKQPATPQTEIYSLGVILYQILSLKLPFFRKNLDHFRRIMKLEMFIPPEEVAPYRDIPKQLSCIAQKCLAKDPKERYHSIQEMIFDVENYIEGKPEWLLEATLNINKEEDWELQENIPLSPRLAINRLIDEIEWVGLMISKTGFSGNIKLEMEIKLPSESKGIGVILCAPSSEERKNLEDGYCLWLSGASKPYGVLFRSNAEIMSVANSGIKNNEPTHLCIEKIDNTVLVYIDGLLKLSYLSHIPLIGSHVGIIYKNSDFDISPIRIHTGARTVMVNCLSVPDAFLANGHFDKALLEYRKIADSFRGRTEEREAQFRAGLTLLEKGKRERYKSKQRQLFSEALEEFEGLKNTPGAPLEYLGKALVYQALGEDDEERKCLELAMRKYPKHPLLSVLKEHILFRLHESSKKDLKCVYHLTLLCLRHMPDVFSSEAHLRLLNRLIHHWAPLPFVDQSYNFSTNLYTHYAIQLTFWLHEPLLLIEMLESLTPGDSSVEELLVEGCFALLYMDKPKEALSLLKEKRALLLHQEATVDLLIHALTDLSCLAALKYLIDHLPEHITFSHVRVCSYLVKRALHSHNSVELLPLLAHLVHHDTPSHEILLMKELYLTLLLLDDRVHHAEEIFSSYSPAELEQPTFPLYFLYGVYLWMTEGQEVALKHFTKGRDLSHLHPMIELILGTPKDKDESLLYWEKKHTYQKLLFLYSVTKHKRLATEYKKKLSKLSP